MLKLFYITNSPQIAVAAQSAGVDRIFVDTEYMGKEERQKGMDTVKNHHTISDVRNVRAVLDSSKLIVRVNPLHKNSKREIDSVIEAGADFVLLPMWKTEKEAAEFVNLVAKRAKTILLLETAEAAQIADRIVKLPGVDEIYIGLNDLHLSLHKTFLFELLTDGTVERLAKIFAANSIPFGFGGFGRVNSRENPLPAENIIAEHYRLSSSAAILSRSFCNFSACNSPEEIEEFFKNEVKEIRCYEKMLLSQSPLFFEDMHCKTVQTVEKIVGAQKENRAE